MKTKKKREKRRNWIKKVIKDYEGEELEEIVDNSRRVKQCESL